MARTWTITLAVVVAVLLVLFIAEVFGSPVSFDGAMNLQVAASLADGHGYARFYDEWILFPEEVQTNAPFVLPASLVFALFGVSLISAQVVSIAYAIALVLAVFWLIRPVAGTAAALAAISLVLISPGFSRFGANGYGEVPGLVWFLLGLGLFCRALKNERISHFLAAGLCLGLAVLTKTVMLMPVGIVLALAGLTLILHLRRQALAATALAFSLPIAAFEIWRGISLGGKTAWFNWWAEQFSSILSQAGVQDGFENIPVWTDKLIGHATILADNLSLPIWVLPILALVPVGLALITLGEFRKPEPSRDRILLMVTLAFSITAYFVWWLLVTPTEKAWPRRIFNGLLLVAIAAPIVLRQAWQSLRENPGQASVVMLPIVALAYAGLANLQLTSLDNRHSAVENVVEFMRNSPQHARFYGYGWYSAPVFSLYSGRRAYNLSAWKHFIEPDTRPHYLLVDVNMVNAEAHTRALRNIEHRTVLDNSPWALVVEISSGFELQPMPIFETEQIVCNADFLESKYGSVQGFHPPEGDGWRWVEPNAHIALRRSPGAKHLVVRGYVPSLEEYRIWGPGDQFVLEATAGDCRLGERSIGQSGHFEVVWPVNSCPGPTGEIVIVTLQANAVMQRVDRSLSWIVNSIGFTNN